MMFERWDVVQVPGFLLGLHDSGPPQYGLVVSAKPAVEGANRYWIVQIPNPGPENLVQGDIEVPGLRGLLRMEYVVIRASSIIAIHQLDLEEDNIPAIARINPQLARTVMDHIKTFLPRGV